MKYNWHRSIILRKLTIKILKCYFYICQMAFFFLSTSFLSFFLHYYFFVSKFFFSKFMAFDVWRNWMDFFSCYFSKYKILLEQSKFIVCCWKHFVWFYQHDLLLFCRFSFQFVYSLSQSLSKKKRKIFFKGSKYFNLVLILLLFIFLSGCYLYVY